MGSRKQTVSTNLCKNNKVRTYGSKWPRWSDHSWRLLPYLHHEIFEIKQVLIRHNEKSSFNADYMICCSLAIMTIKYCVKSRPTDADIFGMCICIISQGANNTQVVTAVKRQRDTRCPKWQYVSDCLADESVDINKSKWPLTEAKQMQHLDM